MLQPVNWRAQVLVRRSINSVLLVAVSLLDGIFATDGAVWRETRKTASHMFSQAKLSLSGRPLIVKDTGGLPGQTSRRASGLDGPACGGCWYGVPPALGSV